MTTAGDSGAPWHIPWPGDSDGPDDPAQSRERALQIHDALNTLQAAGVAVADNAELDFSGTGAPGSPLTAALKGGPAAGKGWDVVNANPRVLGGGLWIGDFGQAPAGNLIFKRTVSGTNYQAGMWVEPGEIDLSHASGPDAVAGNAYWRFLSNGTIQCYTYADGQSRPVPFATYAYNPTISISGAHTGSVLVNFPVGRFTQTPIAVSTPYGTGAYLTYFSAITKDSVTVSARHVDGTVATYSLPTNLLVVQMTPTSAPGLMAATIPGAPYATTCHTEGCENAEHPVENRFVDDVAVDVVCGPCGQPIVDVVPA